MVSGMVYHGVMSTRRAKIDRNITITKSEKGKENMKI